jgi:hypothetical protein
MNITPKKITAYLLALIIVVVTILGILSIWDIIELENVMRKVLSSLLIIFLASVVTLFIFNVVVKDDVDNIK